MSTQADQAVATSTLIMLRSLGGVIGVATSSLVVQNFLLVFLKKNVTGLDREEVVEMVRKSVQSIYSLKGEQLRQGSSLPPYRPIFPLTKRSNGLLQRRAADMFRLHICDYFTRSTIGC